MEHFIWLALTTIGAWFAAYLGSYFRKKGENLATHEDIDKLVDQVRAVTTTTKEIEAKISNEVWDRQKRWELKRDVLFELIKTIPGAFDALASLHSIFQSEKDAAAKGTEPRTTKRLEVMANWMKAASEFEGAILLAALVCSLELKAKLFSISVLMRGVAASTMKGEPEAFQTSLRELLEKREEIWALVRKEMNIDTTS